MGTVTKSCEKCGVQPRVTKERFCVRCRRIMLREMRESGYLQPLPAETTIEPLPAAEGADDVQRQVADRMRELIT